LLCWFTRGLFPCLAPFLWGEVSHPSASPLLSLCGDGLLIVFQFCNVVWLWMLLTGSGDEFLDCYLPCFKQRLITGRLLAFLPFQHLFTDSLVGDQLLALFPFSGTLTAPRLLCCVLVFSSFLLVFFFCRVGGQSAQGAIIVYPRGGWGNTTWHLVLTCLVCWMSPKQIWSWRLVVEEPSCFFSVMWYGEAL
jgi:hypothetical protein